MSLENPDKSTSRSQEVLGNQETPEQKEKRLGALAKIRIKHAYWGFQERGGNDLSFFTSDEFQNFRSEHASLHKSTVGIKEAIQYIKDVLKKNKGTSDTAFPTDPNKQVPENVTVENLTVPVAVTTQAANDLKYAVRNNETQAPQFAEALSTNNPPLAETPPIVPPVVEEVIPEPPIVSEPTISIDTPVAEIGSPGTPLLDETRPTAPPVTKTLTDAPPLVETPSDVESMEGNLEYIEGVKKLTDSFIRFFELLSRYNETTLDNRGNESSESILSQSDLAEIQRSLVAKDGVDSKTSANNMLQSLQQIWDHLMNNSFPVGGGMFIASVESYEILGSAIEELHDSLSTIERSISNNEEQKKFMNFIATLKQDANDLYNLQDRKRAIFERINRR